MTLASIAAVGNRIGQIQGEFERNMPAAVSFADALDAAQQPTETVARFEVTPLASQAATTATPVGILGTSIIVQNRTFAVDGSWAGQLPTAGQEWAAEIESAALEAGLDPRLLAAMVWQESGFQPDAVSRSGAIGLAQLMPGTAEGLGVDPWDPQQNLEGGARYLAWTIEEFGSIDLGLAAYNAGPGRVREAGGIPNIAETQAYVPRVLDYFRQLGGIA
jgi:soluble lytic murein transglycosylase-like protein